MSEPITIPLLNPNEPEANLAALHVREGQQVSQGEPIATLETTKSAVDLLAEEGGYIIGLRFEQGQTVRAGEILCYLAEEADWSPPAPEIRAQDDPKIPTGGKPPPGLRITQPALALAQQLGIDLTSLPTAQLVTEAAIRSAAESQNKSQIASRLAMTSGFFDQVEAFDPQAIVVYGGGGHGKTVIEFLRSLQTYRIVGVLDDGLNAGERILGLPVLGGSQLLPELYSQGIRLAVNAVGGIGHISTRIKIFDRLIKAGFACPALAHPSAFIEPSATISAGVQVFAHGYLGSESRIGFGCIINTGAIVSHDCLLGEYVNVSPGAILAGEVQIGNEALIGMGTTINLRVRVGARARIGNGATIKEDVPENGIVRAGSIWP